MTLRRKSLPSLLLSGVLVFLTGLVHCPSYLNAQRTERVNFSQTRRDSHPKYAPGEVLVRFRSTITTKAAQAIHDRLGARATRTWKGIEGLERVSLPADLSVPEAIRLYREDPSVLYAEPNYVLHTLGLPNDPQFGQQWNLRNTGQDGGVIGADIRAAQAWDLTTGSNNVVIAVIDTGIDTTHPDLLPNLFRNSPECTPNGLDDDNNGYVDDCYGAAPVYGTGNPQDDYGHGTHVAGIIGAAGNNGSGVAGVNWSVRVLACKFLDAEGYGYTSDAIACLEYVKQMKQRGVPIVASNNSWAGGEFSEALADAIVGQLTEGILFVAAAGNAFANNDIAPEYPASYFLPDILSVSATTRFDDLVGFSSFGRFSVHLGAPGAEILSTVPGGGLAVASGTSMAAPHVAGVAALLKAQDPTRDWRAIRNLILAGGQPMPSLAEKTITGRRLDAFGALTCSQSAVKSRLLPNMAALPGAVGDPIRLAVLNIDCAQPAGTVEVTVQPGGLTVTLRDDGMSPDAAAGDGIYSADWMPPALGSYLLLFPDGDEVRVVVLQNYEGVQSDSAYRNTSGTSLDLGDDSIGQIDAPFPILYGGGSFTTLYVGANGTISFTNAFSDFQNGNIPVDYWRAIRPDNPAAVDVQAPVVTLVAPFWDDLNPIRGTSENVFWEVTGTAPNRELVIEWRDVRAYECRSDPNATIKFQVVFQEGSTDLLFQYADVTFGGACNNHDLGGSASVGVQVSQRVGTRWGHPYVPTRSLADNFTIKWRIPTGSPGDNPAPTITSLSPDRVTVGSSDTLVTVNGTGFIPGTSVEIGYFRRATFYRSSTEVQFMLHESELRVPNWIQVAVVNPAPGGGAAFTNFIVDALLPTLTSITPDTVPAGSFSFVMTLRGTNFNPWSSLKWEPAALGTGFSSAGKYISSTEIQATVSAYWLLEPGTATVRVTNGQDKDSNGLTFTIAQALAGAILAPGVPSATSQNGLPAPPATGPETARAALPPFRFLGWKLAQYFGKEYALRYLRPRANLAPPAPVPVETRSSVAAFGGTIAAQSSAPSPPLAGFQERPRVPTDYLPSAIEVADLNRDGKADWVIANAGSQSLWLYMGRGDGTAELPRVVPVKGYSPVDVKAADMDGDGLLDLVVAEADSGTVGVLLGNGDGTFGPERRYYTPGLPLSLAIADFNLDGKLDVVAGQFSVSSIGPLAFLPGLGGGRLGAPVTTYGQTQSGLYLMNPVRMADLDNDGLQDIVGVELSFSPLGGGVNPYSQLGTGSQVYLNQGNGQFKRIQLFDTSHGGYQWLTGNIHVVSTVALGDADKDGCVDATTVDYFDVAVFFPGKCDGTFDTSRARLIGTGTPGGDAALVDMNGDGNLDLVVSGFLQFDFYLQQTSAGHVVSVALGDGTGSFAAPRVYRGLPDMFSLAVADLNGDLRPDVIATHEGRDAATFYFNDGTGGLGSPQGDYVGYLTRRSTPAVSNSPFTPFAYADVSGDGRKDLVYIERGDTAPQPGVLSVLLRDGGGGFGAPIRSALLDTGSYPVDIILGDFRNTGRLDALLLSTVGSLWYYALARNNGDGTFLTPNSKFFGDIAPDMLIAGDFNRDGKLDFVAPAIYFGTNQGVTSATPRLVPFFGNGDGTFTRGTETVLTPPSGTSSYIGHGFARDFNRDGNLDLLVWGQALLNANESSAVYQLLGNGDGTFQPARLVFNNFNYYTLADVNEDGLDDIVAVERTTTGPEEYYPLKYAIFLAQADGSFQPGATYGPMGGEFNLHYLFGTRTQPLKPFQPMLADFNGDGHLDIAGFQGLTASFFGPGFISSGYLGTVLQILAGNGDGTFVPSYVPFEIGRTAVPQLAADINGDGWADLVEFNTFSASYHVLYAKPGPAFSIAPVSDPVIGNKGKVRIILARPAGPDATLDLSASDPNVTLPSSATVASGMLSTDVEFTIGSAFDPLRVFTIEARWGGESHAAYLTQARPDQQVGFVALLENPQQRIPRGGTTGNYSLFLASTGGYSTELEISCSGLPAGATCLLASTRVALPAGSLQIVSVQASTELLIEPRNYTFTVQITDGVVTEQLTASLSVSDFLLSISPASASTDASGRAQYSVSVLDINGFPGTITISCNQGLPSGARCYQDGAYAFPGSGIALVIGTEGTAPGSYTLTVTGTSGQLVRSATATLVVNAGTVSASVGPSSANVSVGGSATFSATLSSQGGASGSFTLSCVNPPNGISCSFNPNPLSLQPNSSATSTLTVNVTSRPSLIVPRQYPPERPFQPPWEIVLLGIVMFALALLGQRARELRLAPTCAVVVLIVAAFALGSCGGGGTSSPPPPLQPTTVVLRLQASSSTMTVDLGTITLNIR